MSHLLGRERSLRQQCRRGRLPVRPAAPDRQGEQASYAGITMHLRPKTKLSSLVQGLPRGLQLGKSQELSLPIAVCLPRIRRIFAARTSCARTARFAEKQMRGK